MAINTHYLTCPPIPSKPRTPDFAEWEERMLMRMYNERYLKLRARNFSSARAHKIVQGELRLAEMLRSA